MASKYILLLSLSWFCSLFASAQKQNTIITNSKFLKDPDILVSNNGRFKMGFFSPDNSSNRYIGIWYNTYNSINNYDDPLEVVWVFNRDNPLNDSSGVFKVSELDGNLVLLNGQNMIFWSSNVHLGANSSSIAHLEDTGNLVLVRDASDESIVWQSFDHPTNAMLPQMKLSIDKNMNEKQLFKSWKSPSDPSSGRYTVGINPRRLQPTEAFIWDGDLPYWRSGPWNGNMFIGVPYMNPVPQDGISLVNDNEGKFILSFSLASQSMLTYLVLNSDGNLVRNYWDSGNHNKWIVLWKSRESECDIYGKCGSFGSCNSKKSPICGCLKGFEPKNKEEWNIRNWTSGCVRRTPLESCGSTRGKADGFSRLRNTKVPDHSEWVTSDDQQDCGKQCLGKCQCLAYSYYAGIGCMMWNTSLVDIQEFSSNYGVDLFIRLADSELGRNSKWKIILLVVMIMGITTTCVVMYFLWRCNIMSRRNGKKVVSIDKLVHPNMNTVELIKDLPLFSFEKLGIATNNFDETKKLGRGGFGPVYKGELEDGQEIAVKRLARSSGQGLQEFMNEVVLISKLQHMNLVRLLGCCVERDEKMLVYEYMPNKSLNALLFDSLHKETLDWKARFNIIEGICRGLLYLHRDLKPSNILLDRDLNPKISDFGMARIFGRHEHQVNTLRVVGTYGYMSPEYAMKGQFSEKSDVFSFGVILLEIVSGRSTSSFDDDDDDGLGLLGYALNRKYTEIGQ